MRRLALFLCLPAVLPAQAAEWTCVRTPKANVRVLPGTGEPVLWRAWIHTPFRIVERRGDWALAMDFQKDTGWLHDSVLTAGPCVTVRTKRANIREGPGIQFEAVWRADRGYTFRVLDRRGKWLRVTDEDEIAGWIHLSAVWGDSRLPAEKRPGVKAGVRH